MRETYSVGDVFEVQGVPYALYWTMREQLGLLLLGDVLQCFSPGGTQSVPWMGTNANIPVEIILPLFGMHEIRKLDGAKVVIQYPEVETRALPAKELDAVPWPGEPSAEWQQIQEAVSAQSRGWLRRMRLLVESHCAQPAKPKLPVDWYGRIRRELGQPRWSKLRSGAQIHWRHVAEAFARVFKAELPDGWDDATCSTTPASGGSDHFREQVKKVDDDPLA